MGNIKIDITCASKKWAKIFKDIKPIIKKAIITALGETSILQKCRNTEISVLLTDNLGIKKLNKIYRGKDKATNVLSFPLMDIKAGKYGNLPQDIILGDIILAYSIIAEEALKQNKPFINHLTHLCIHGALHLVGYDHEREKDAEKMESLEIKILTYLAIPNPYKD